jgi:UDP-N-acetylglucosamine--N-acetylmuramyl-(pentapeptide) pyrophosphoryl-undecaprenol N-acetylglucosamine transferase
VKVLVVASHSAGHILPAIAFCQGLKQKDAHTEIIFVSTDGELEKKILNNNIDKLIFFRKEKINIFTVFRLLSLILRAKSIINESGPDLIVGFGGYLSIPFIICAYSLKISNFIHEQNFHMGLANRFLANITNQIIFSFPNSEISDRLRMKALFLGLPLRKEMRLIDKQEARRYLNLDTHKFTLLVTGGSQGSSSINTQILDVMKDREMKEAQVIHVAGLADYKRVEEEYRRIAVKNKVFDFAERMEYAFSACDLAICRAGAGTIAEIVALRVPSILIPYPYARKHQLSNARFLAEKNAAVLIEENEELGNILKEKIIDLKNNSDRLRQLSQALDKVSFPNSRDRMVEFTFKFVKN